MRTETLQRVYCDGALCQGEPFEVWMPSDPDDIPDALREVGAYVELHELHVRFGPRYALGRVLCPKCAKEACP